MASNVNIYLQICWLYCQVYFFNLKAQINDSNQFQSKHYLQIFTKYLIFILFIFYILLNIPSHPVWFLFNISSSGFCLGWNSPELSAPNLPSNPVRRQRPLFLSKMLNSLSQTFWFHLWDWWFLWRDGSYSPIPENWTVADGDRVGTARTSLTARSSVRTGARSTLAPSCPFATGNWDCLHFLFRVAWKFGRLWQFPRRCSIEPEKNKSL